MINEFSRTEMLIGAEKMNTLKNSTVAVFGWAELDPMQWRPWPDAAWAA
ncbi:molybdopterin/thiamine biosynthesis protein ThiF [Enterocloster clostridioformis]|uniref:Molybdopterin/thiamine biosynthesis protein ThiF n=1 Tax=Enterocloster clostridioformis TaxID=1531 RepID=A0A2X2UDM2_9FIRM|nr:molybdopterin/thiamine biosynthesis protein ThiF [Enterocloster clostridioformis]